MFAEECNHAKMSFRSKGTFSENDFARKHFNGGGQMNASGGKKNGALCDVLYNFENLLPVYKSSLVETLMELGE